MYQKRGNLVVLPAIREDGSYGAGKEKVAAGGMCDDEFMGRAALLPT